MTDIVLWLVKLIPIAYRFPAVMIGVVALSLLGGWGGWTLHSWMVADDKVATLERLIVQERSTHEKELKIARDNVRVVTEYVDRVEVVHEKGKTIIKEIPVYVKADAQCESLPAAWGMFHDAAAGATLPDDRSATRNSDAPAARIDLSRSAGVVAENYTRCEERAAQIAGLQDWAMSITHRQLENERNHNDSNL